MSNVETDTGHDLRAERDRLAENVIEACKAWSRHDKRFMGVRLQQAVDALIEFEQRHQAQGAKVSWASR